MSDMTTRCAALLLGSLLLLGRPSLAATAPDLDERAARLVARLDAEPMTEALSARNASYAIDVDLDLGAHTLEGVQVVRYGNLTQTPMEDVQLHLYLNAFKNLKSTFMRESGGQLRGDRYKEGGWGAIDIEEIRVVGGDSLVGSLQLIQPDDGNADDQTVARVPLPAPVLPGEHVDLLVVFKATLPKVFARTGFRGSFHMVGQWFPKLGVFEARPGLPARWNCHQFHASSEFFSDYGIYDVRVSTDPAAVVGASGSLLEEPEVEGGRKVHHFRAEDVHDFAFAADVDFREAKETWRDVTLRLLYQPEHEPTVRLHMDGARKALEFFDRYGPYPYPTLTMIDPGPGASGAAGMEYPTLITVGTRVHSVRRQLYGWLARVNDTELTLLHELGHQYWYGLVGNNEFEEAWLDEGFNSYSESKALDVPVAELLGGRVALSDLGLHRSVYLAIPHEGPVLNPSWTYPSLTGYGVASYSKAAVVLRTFENLVGEEVMEEALEAYVAAWRFRHPRSEDFFRVVNDATGQDYTWFWDQFVRRDMAVDYGVRSVRNRRVRDVAGLFDVDGKRVEVTAEEAASRRKREAGAAGATYRTEVLLVRREEGTLPVDYEVLFDDGSTEKGSWDGRARALRLNFEGSRRAVRARVDPEGKVLLDVSRANDCAYAAGAPSPWDAFAGDRVDRDPVDDDAPGQKELEASRSTASWFREAAAAAAAALAAAATLFL